MIAFISNSPHKYEKMLVIPHTGRATMLFMEWQMINRQHLDQVGVIVEPDESPLPMIHSVFYISFQCHPDKKMELFESAAQYINEFL